MSFCGEIQSPRTLITSFPLLSPLQNPLHLPHMETLTGHYLIRDSGDYIDVISSKNKVYALTATCGVQAWDFSQSGPVKTLDVKPSLEEETVYDIIMGRITKDMSPRPFYLVETNGELFIFARYYQSRYDQDSLSITIDPWFWLYKLNFEGLKWETKKKNKEEDEDEDEEEELWLMDRVIFLGKGECVSYSTRDLPGYNLGIYFADDPERLRYGYIGDKYREIKLPAFWLVS